MNVLRAKLVARAAEERARKLDDLRGERQANEWGSQIRSYVLQPYQLVKDHRTGAETGNVTEVLDGEHRHLRLAVPPAKSARVNALVTMRARQSSSGLGASSMRRCFRGSARSNTRPIATLVDFGIFAQTVTSAFGCFCNPVEGSHWAFHFSPILYPVGLAVWLVHVAAHARRSAGDAGALVAPPVYALVRARRDIATARLAGVVAWLYPPLAGLIFGDFHENGFAPAAVAWTLYFFDAGLLRWTSSELSLRLQ